MSGNELHYKDTRSGIMVNGVGRGNRALLYSMGLEEDDFRKPIIGIANSFSELVPGHIHLRELARDVSDGILEAGGIPREFDTIALCDGLCQGHSGMRYSPAQPGNHCGLGGSRGPGQPAGCCGDAGQLRQDRPRDDPGRSRMKIPAIIVTGGPMIPATVTGMTTSA